MALRQLIIGKKLEALREKLAGVNRRGEEIAARREAMQKREEELAALRGERMENTFGSQIRNYVLYPYQMVKDLRSGIETGNVDAVLGGEIDEFVIGYHRWKAAQ